MYQSDDERLKCREHLESPAKKNRHVTNPLIAVDIVHKKYPYFCCSIHESEFASDFQSEEENILLNDEFGGILFLKSDGDSEIQIMSSKDEIGVQCNHGAPVSLKQLSSLPVYCADSRVIGVKCQTRPMMHEPLIILPRPWAYDEDEDDGTFTCKHCFKVFISGQALGGHMSRKHPLSR